MSSCAGLGVRLLLADCLTHNFIKTTPMISANLPVKIRDVVIPNDLDDVRKLWLAYLVWGNNEMQALYGVHPHNPVEAVEQDLEGIDKFQPPHGRLLLAAQKSTNY